jgi:hypothetical protein
MPPCSRSKDSTQADGTLHKNTKIKNKVTVEGGTGSHRRRGKLVQQAGTGTR